MVIVAKILPLVFYYSCNVLCTKCLYLDLIIIVLLSCNNYQDHVWLYKSIYPLNSAIIIGFYNVSYLYFYFNIFQIVLLSCF